jgi:hypothetical protein
MTITKKSGRQDVIAAGASGTYADLTDDTYMAAVDLPGGAIVTGGFLAITTLFNSATDDKFSIGDKVGAAAATKTTYAALSADITAVGIIEIVPTGTKYTEPSTVGVVWNGSGTAPSAGAWRLHVEYIVDGRAAFAQG